MLVSALVGPLLSASRSLVLPPSRTPIGYSNLPREEGRPYPPCPVASECAPSSGVRSARRSFALSSRPRFARVVGYDGPPGRLVHKVLARVAVHRVDYLIGLRRAAGREAGSERGRGGRAGDVTPLAGCPLKRQA